MGERMEDQIHEFEYRLRGWGMLYLGSACLILGVTGAVLALGEMGFGGPWPGERIFQLLLALVLVPGAFCMVWLWRQGIKHPKTIRISKTHVTLPRRPISRKTVTIPLDEIGTLEQVSNRGTAFIRIGYGKTTVAIPDVQVESRDEFQRIFDLLSSGVGRASHRS